MIEPLAFASFVLACAAIVVVPGPTVTVIIANSLKSGSRAGLANVAGTQFGLAIMIVVLALGLETIVTAMSHVFVYVKLLGAAYLIWLGVQLWRSNGSLADPTDMKVKRRSMNGYFWQGFLVIWSNPKALFFFGSFIPQFLNPDGNLAFQTVLLGGTFMIVATVFDSVYAILAGRTGTWLTSANVRLVERISGTCLIGGGLWLAFSRRAA
ncbi:MAG: LysE family translocator [Pseudomonadota bacterium]